MRVSNEQTVSKAKEPGNTPTSRTEPVASCESFAAVNGKRRANTNCSNEVDGARCSRSNTQDKRIKITRTPVASCESFAAVNGKRRANTNCSNEVDGARCSRSNTQDKRIKITRTVKSVLDPCEDTNEDTQDDGVRLGDDSQEDQVALAGCNQRERGPPPMLDTDTLIQILIRTPRQLHPVLYHVSKEFRAIVSSSEFRETRRRQGLAEELLCIRHRFEFTSPQWYILHKEQNPFPLARLVQLPAFPVIAQSSGVTTLASTIYVIGGKRQDQNLCEMWFFDIVLSRDWQRGPNMSKPCGDPHVATLDGVIYVVHSNHYSHTNFGETFSLGRWQTFNPPPYEFIYVDRIAAVDGKLWVWSRQIFIFDPTSQGWSIAPEVFSLIPSEADKINGVWYRCSGVTEEVQSFDEVTRTWQFADHLHSNINDSREKSKLAGSRFFWIVERHEEEGIVEGLLSHTFLTEVVDGRVAWTENILSEPYPVHFYPHEFFYFNDVDCVPVYV